MTKRYPIFLILILLSNATHAMTRTKDYDAILEDKFGLYRQTNPNEDEADLFNRFVAMHTYLLLSSSNSIIKLNKKIFQSQNPVATVPNGYQVDRDLATKVEKSKKKYQALFDFVKKYQNTYSINPQMLEDLEALEKFTEPITCTLGVLHEGKAMTADAFLALEDVDAAKKDSVRITVFEQTQAKVLPATLDRLPSEQAIRDLPAAVQTFRTLQDKYAQFIHDYPEHEDRADYEQRLAESKQLMDRLHPEYLKDQPSKKEIEGIYVRAFLRRVGYGRALQEKFDNLKKCENPEQKEKGCIEIIGVAESMEAYTRKYPTLDPEYSSVLHKAAHRIFSIFDLTPSDNNG